MSLNEFLTVQTTTAASAGTPLENGQAVNTRTGGLVDTSDPAAFMSTTRSASLPVGAESPTQTYTTGSWASDTGEDWRVRISLPALPGYDSSPILAPLRNSNNSMVWPITPQVILNHSASYNSLTPVHSNYSYPIYQNSHLEDIQIFGEFPVENEDDGRYWIAAVHFMRSITKMYYGVNSSLRGAPPPVVKLNGYGGFIFKDIPVVVKLFTVDLPNSVDYIKVPISNSVSLDLGSNITVGDFAYVPTLSTISVQLALAPSRDSVRQFSLESFIKGDYIPGGRYI
jgi:hypothetical protein